MFVSSVVVRGLWGSLLCFDCARCMCVCFSGLEARRCVRRLRVDFRPMVVWKRLDEG